MLGTQFNAARKEATNCLKILNPRFSSTTLAAILDPVMLQRISYVLAYLPLAITAFNIPTYHELNDICEAAGPNAVRLQLFYSTRTFY
jgi:hypothetical protein